MAMPSVTITRQSGLGWKDNLLENLLVKAGHFARKSSTGVFMPASTFVKACASDRAMTTLRLSDDAHFTFPLGDKYWSKAFFLKRVYEAELDYLFRSLKDVPYGLIDCGANFGYWSVLVSSREFGCHPVIAVELSQSNFGILRRNAALNGNRFGTLHRAVHSTSGSELQIYGRNHFGLSVSPGDTLRKDFPLIEKATTITLDECAKHLEGAHGQLIVKLDVEGAEIDAIKGASRLLKENVLFVYEDDRQEPTHATTRAFMRDGGLAIFAIWPDRQPTRIDALDEIASLKAKRVCNFAAVPKSSSWMEVMTNAQHWRKEV